jgi:hypothetical protein
MLLSTNMNSRYPVKGGSIIDTYKTVKAVAFGQSDFQPAQRALLEKYGHLTITNAVVVRTPVESAIVKAMDIISKNQFQKNLNSAPFDQLYHLQLDVTLSNGKKVRMEKIEVVNLQIGKTNTKTMEREKIDNIPQGVTLLEFVEAGQKRMGSKFFPYDSKSNNCQDFILNMLQANNFGSAEDFTFVKQDTDQLFKRTGKLGKVANALTDIGAKANLLMKGAGFVV